MNDIGEIDKFEPDSWFWDLNDFAREWLTEPRYYYSLAVIYCKYLYWLNPGKKPDISNDELALITFYNGEKISRGKNPTKLYQRFKHYESHYNRIGPADSVIKNKNQVRLFKRIVEKLSGNAKIKAEKDLSELKKNIAGAIYCDKDL